MSIKLFDIDGSLSVSEDPNTHQIFDAGHNQIAQLDHHQSLNDIYGQTIMHIDANNGIISDNNLNNLGTITHHAGTPVDQLSITDNSGAIQSHVSEDGSITNASGQLLGTFKNEW